MRILEITHEGTNQVKDSKARILVNDYEMFKELIEQRGWGKFCKHQNFGYAAVVREFYSNLVRRKENSVFVRGVWVPYGAETINAMYGMEGQKHGSKYKKIADRPNRE